MDVDFNKPHFYEGIKLLQDLARREQLPFEVVLAEYTADLARATDKDPEGWQFLLCCQNIVELNEPWKD